MSEINEQTPEQAIRLAAWEEARVTYRHWETAINKARGGAGGGGYRDPHARAEVNRLRTLLDNLIAEHGFQGTYVDPLGLSWVERQSASRECPPLAGA